MIYIRFKKKKKQECPFGKLITLLLHELTCNKNNDQILPFTKVSIVISDGPRTSQAHPPLGHPPPSRFSR